MNISTNLKRLLAAAGAAAAVALAAPAASLASSVTLGSGGVLQVTGAASEANHVVLSYDWSRGLYLIQDSGASALANSAPKCSAVDAHLVSCPLFSFATIAVQLGDAGGYAEDDLDVTTVSIRGGAGNDTLIGGGGITTLDGAGGANTLTAGNGPTRLIGGSGTTTMNGGPSGDTFVGGSGVDIIHAADTHGESVSCGAGLDVVTADPKDTLAPDCETSSRTSGTDAAGGPGVPGGADDSTGATREGASLLPPQVATIDSQGRVPVAVVCPADAVGGCDVAISLSALGTRGGATAKVVAARREPPRRPRAIGRTGRFHIAAGRRVVVPVKLARRTMRVFKHGRRSLKLRVAVSVKTAAGLRTSTQALTVTAARRRPPRTATRSRKT